MGAGMSKDVSLLGSKKDQPVTHFKIMHFPPVVTRSWGTLAASDY